MKRHLFKRTETKNGKKTTKWYYWFYDENGKQIKKTCGKNGKPCLLKREAEAFLAELEKEDERKSEVKPIRLRDVGETLYDSGSYYMMLKESRGQKLQPQTIIQKKRFMKTILAEFGDRIPSTIAEGEIENYIVMLKIKNSHKNELLGTFRELFKECKRLGLVEHKLDIENFSRSDVQKKDIFTIEQLSEMFPDDYSQLSKVWSNEIGDKYTGVDGAVHDYGFMFGVLYRLMVSTGLRPGEARAIKLEQVQQNGLYVTRMIDGLNKERPFLKKGNAENNRHRAVLIPSKMMKILLDYIQIRPVCEGGYIFSMDGSPVKRGTFENRFKRALEKLGILPDSEKKLSPHSLRFTYNTYTIKSNMVTGEALRKMIGHTSEAMTDYYTRPSLQSELQGLQPFQNNVDAIWNIIN